MTFLDVDQVRTKCHTGKRQREKRDSLYSILLLGGFFVGFFFLTKKDFSKSLLQEEWRYLVLQVLQVEKAKNYVRLKIFLVSYL